MSSHAHVLCRFKQPIEKVCEGSIEFENDVFIKKNYSLRRFQK